MTENELLTEMFLKYWQWDIVPTLTNPPANSPEYFVKSLYENLKANALARYPWRSATVYTTITPSVPEVSSDGRYKYEAAIPDNFVLATGFWRDRQRLHPAHNEVDIVGKVARTNLPEFTMSYINYKTDEKDLDPWVCDYIQIFIAAELSDIGGQTPERKQFLDNLAETMLIKCGNKDFEMSHHDPISNSLNQFEWC